MRRQLIPMVVCVVCLVAGTAWSACLEYVGGLSYTPHGDAVAVAVSGDFAYYNSGPVLYAVDISTPADPQIVGEVTLPGDIAAMAVNGSIAYVAIGSGGVCTVDVSNPSAPEDTSCLDLVESTDVAVSGGYLYVANGSAGLGVFDLANREVPVEVGRTPSLRAVAVALTRSGACTFALVADWRAGLRVLDVSDPSRPLQVGHYEDSGLVALDVAVSGGYAFVADGWNSLRMIDVSTPSTPVQVGNLGVGPHSIYTNSVAVSQSHAYISGAGVVAVDANPPTAPVIAGSASNPGFAHDIAVAGGFVYVADQQAGLSVFRECESAPAEFGSIECGVAHAGFQSFIPAAAFERGAAKSFFQSDIEISNTGESDAEVWFAWLPRGQDNPDPLLSADYVLARGESRYFENALAGIFGLGPDSSGALRLTSTSESVIAMSRISSIPDGEAGTFGQGMPAIPARDMIARGERRRITFLCEDDTKRANVGCVNGTGRPIQISIGIYDSAGAELEVRTMRLGAYANDQINRVFQPWEPTHGYVDVWSDTAAALFTCYGSVVDNLTNDPMTVLPQ